MCKDHLMVLGLIVNQRFRVSAQTPLYFLCVKNLFNCQWYIIAYFFLFFKSSNSFQLKYVVLAIDVVLILTTKQNLIFLSWREEQAKSKAFIGFLAIKHRYCMIFILPIVKARTNAIMFPIHSKSDFLVSCAGLWLQKI